MDVFCVVIWPLLCAQESWVSFILIRTPVWMRVPCQRPHFNLITCLVTLSPNTAAFCYLEAKLVDFKSSQFSS